MRAYLLMLALLGISSYSYAQFLADKIDPTFLNPELRRDNSISKVQGSPFLIDNWSKGRVKIINGQVFENINIKFDIYADEVVVDNQGTEASIYKDKISSFTILGARDSVIYHFVKPSNDGGFYHQVYQGKSGVYQKFKKRIHTSEVNSGGFSSPGGKSVFLSEVYTFIKTSSGQMIEFDKEKTLYSIYPDKANQIKEYIKNNKLKIKNIADLVKVVAYVDSL